MGTYLTRITIEGVSGCMKCGLMSKFHSVCSKYLPINVTESEFRRNTRKMDYGQRM